MLTSPRPVRRALTVALATAVLAGPVALAAPAAIAAPRADAAKPNERAPREQGLPESGDAPWATSVANDVKGYRVSAYTGKYYDARFEQYRLCVAQRESGGNGYADYRIVSRSFHGAYQFGTGWNSASSLVKRLRPEMVKTYGDAAAEQLAQLSKTPVSRWNRFWQDAAFWTVFNRGKGYGQWSGGEWYCDHRPNAEKGWPGNHPRAKYGKKGSLEGPSTPSTPAAASTDTKPTTATKPQTRGGTPKSNQRLARNYISSTYGWGKKEFRALKKHWFKESNWLHTVINPMGPWHGLGQVNGRFIRDQGYTIRQYMASPLIQIKVGTAYIKQRYGTPISAWQHFRANGWY